MSSRPLRPLLAAIALFSLGVGAVLYFSNSGHPGVREGLLSSPKEEIEANSSAPSSIVSLLRESSVAPIPEVPEIPESSDAPPKFELPSEPIREDLSRIEPMPTEQPVATAQTEVVSLGQVIDPLQDSFDSDMEVDLGGLYGTEGHEPKRANGSPDSLSKRPGYEDTWVNPYKVVNPKNKLRMRAGWLIPAVLAQNISSEKGGAVRAIVAHDVFDSVTGDHRLIPQGAMLYGEYVGGAPLGSERLMIQWSRIDFPDGGVLMIDKMPAESGSGEMGLKGKVDNRYGDILVAGALLTAISVGYEITQNNRGTTHYRGTYRSNKEIAENVVARNIYDLTTKAIEPRLELAPIHSFEVGMEFNVLVTKDLVFDREY